LSSPPATAILAAGGSGDRARDLADTRPKQFRSLRDRPLWEWSYDVLRALCDPVIVVVPEGLVAELNDRQVRAVAGGDTRQASVANGLAQVVSEQVVIHDAARPFVTPDILQSAIDALDDADGAFAAIPVRETLAHLRDGAMTGVVPRAAILSVQTPQAFWTAALKDAHTKARGEQISDATDDAQLVAKYGYKVVPIQGDARNLKVTYVEDFDLADALLAGN
jgi:2-C-methyl-D-erythritol 4-phosphate cytidylyltransferase